jgi:Bacterial archaeo-eukaryotic release factor family 7
MDILKRNELVELTAERRGPSVSIFMPTHRVAGREVREDSLRCKNLINEAEERLTQMGLRSPDAREIMAPARELLDEEYFWLHQAEGLALFLAPDYFRRFRVPIPLEELAVVGERFHVKPLIPLLMADGRFFVLAFSQKKVRLLQGSRFGVRELDTESLPQGLRELLEMSEYQQTSFHMTAPSSMTRGPSPGISRATVQGVSTPQSQAGGTDKRQQLEQVVHQFLVRLNGGLTDLLHDETAPLVLAADEGLQGDYRQVNSYGQLWPEGITGNPDEASAEDLHRQAYEILKPHFERSRREAEEHFHSLTGDRSEQGRSVTSGARALDSIEQIVPAAAYGNVQRLFVATDAGRWGRFDEAEGKVELHDEFRPGDVDLLDFAAVKALTQSGEVYAVPREEVPGGGIVAAVLRY